MRVAVNIIILLFFGVCVFLLNDASVSARRLPDAKPSSLSIVHVNSQKDIYQVYKSAGLSGAKVVHLNRFLNLVDYFPKEESVSAPFPVRVGDSRSLYEKGLDAHNWLFVANRTGMVRSVVVVLPQEVFEQRLPEFESYFAYTVSGRTVKGYSYDMPMFVAALDSLPVINEPVVVNIDAGFFSEGVDPAGAVKQLKMKCPDIRLIVFSSSFDEPEVGDAMRERLSLFSRVWAEQ
ncbi:MAG: hypothetical protein EPN22_04750 [Nitrospirae bacterium]|nr:MAG: hypothetical protein EPN22_04750 [Nitrospirota bacterium]